jgi:hypothetical protein
MASVRNVSVSVISAVIAGVEGPLCEDCRDVECGVTFVGLCIPSRYLLVFAESELLLAVVRPPSVH